MVKQSTHSEKADTEESPKLARIFIIVFIILIAISIGASNLFYIQKKNSDLEAFKTHQTEGLHQIRESTNYFFKIAISDVKIASKHVELFHFLENGAKEHSNNYAKELSAFVEFREIYDQMRYLDEDGMEMIRVNCNDGDPFVVLDNDLQFKGDRYYFRDTFAIEEEEIFVSPLDLNIENGEIEQPIKPMIRIGLPIFHDDVKRGILIANYLGQELLNNIDNVAGVRNISAYLINRDGYWISGPDSESEWGFMYEDKQDLTIAKTDPILWERITSSDETQFFHDGGLYAVEKLYPFTLAQASSTGAREAFSPSLDTLDPEEYIWYLISYIPEEQLFANLITLYKILLVVNGVIMFILGFSGLLIYRATKSRLMAEKRILELNDVLRIIIKILRHDLANDFTAIKGLIDLIKMDKKKTPEFLKDIRSASQRGTERIQEMRNLEQSVNIEQEGKRYRMSALIKKVMKDRKLKFHITGDATLHADEALQVVLDNIVNNAERHGGAKTISFSITNKKDGIEIIVANDGKNISEEAVDQIFDEGFTFGKTGNTGLGMFIAQKTIERYGGAIYVKNNESKGVQFVINLPSSRVA